MRILVAVIGAVVVAATVVVVGAWWRLASEAARWEGAEEIASQSIEKDGNVWRVAIESKIDRPAWLVWEALKQPERSSEFIDSFRRSELLEEEDGRKLVRMQAQVLTLPAISFDAEFRYDDAARRATMRSLRSSAQDIEAAYEIAASPDGAKSLVRYTATVTQKVNLPLAESVQRGAIQELFVKTIRALHVGIETAEREAHDAAARWAESDAIDVESIERQGTSWKVAFESNVAAPVDLLWKAFHEPDRWGAASSAIDRVRVLESGAASRTIELRARLLTLPPQTLRVEITYDDAAKTARIRTLEAPLQDLEGSYRLEGNPGGPTRILFAATATDRVAVPPPEDVQKAALRQFFVETVAALERLSLATAG